MSIFTQPGDVIRGTVVNAEIYPPLDPVADPYNTEKRVIRVILDGGRTVTVNCWGQQFKALKETMRAADVDDLYPGTAFAAKYVRDAEMANPRWTAPKVLAFSINGCRPRKTKVTPVNCGSHIGYR
ncbi:MAG: hypothetical protein EPO57_09220 [Chitinophagaceae bacterium]|nr:MAG: hypothetical protein EPO57_09220 [Chitinophagaceae bacterium]